LLVGRLGESPAQTLVILGQLSVPFEGSPEPGTERRLSRDRPDAASPPFRCLKSGHG